MSTNDKKSSFEKDLKKLESIVSDMESENINLESLVRNYKEGLGLITKCREKLIRSEILIKNSTDTNNS
jgi:exodeoxyribonuclease VII small subunit